MQAGNRSTIPDDDDVVFRDASSRTGTYDMSDDSQGGRGAFRPVMRGTHGAIASGCSLATLAGYDVMRKGGNAIDAGVAVGICQCVVEHDRTTLGGVAPIIIYDARRKKVTTVGGLGRWPAAASPAYFRQFGNKFPAGIATTITPAAMDAWLLALERYGTMKFADVAEKALIYAEEGFPVSEVLREDIVEYEPGFRKWPSTAKVFTPRGHIPAVGEMLKQPALASSLRKFVQVEHQAARRGRIAGLQAIRKYFYEGPVARSMVAFSQQHGGLISMDDLRNFRVREEEPVRLRYGNIDVYTCGTWTQGPALLQVLGMLRGYDVRRMGHNATAYIHTVVEAVKLAFADRDAYYGDPDFVHVPLRELLSEAYCSERRKLIDPERAAPDLPEPGMVRGAKPYFGGRAPHLDEPDEPDDGLTPDTTVLCTMDAAGNILCAAPSDPVLRHMIVPELGFGMSPRGTQSWLHPNHPAVLAPGKRPRLTTNPVLALKNGKPYLAVATPGGDVQPQSMLQALLNAHVFGANAQRATELPRFASFSAPNSFYPHRRYPGQLAAETRIASGILDELSALGHKIKRWPPMSGNAGGVCMIVRDSKTGVLHAGADPRRDGYAEAY